VDGGLADGDRARVDVRDHGFTVGDGVFETMRTVVDRSGSVVAFACDRHLARLARSAQRLGLPPPEASVVRSAIDAVCAANPELRSAGRVRVTCTSGVGPPGSARGDARPTLVITASTAPPWPATARVAVSPWPRNERSPLAGAKTTSYAENVVALTHARRLGADEAIMANLSGDLCEATASNVFLVTGDRVTTPPLATGCLPGITRELLLAWAARAGIAVQQVAQRLEALSAAEEIMLTSTTRQVQPVTEVLNPSGEVIWSRGGVGPMGALLAEVFAREASADPNP
jgi:branched-chain amino acid aminotransferase